MSATLRDEGLFVLEVEAAKSDSSASGARSAWRARRDLLDVTRTLATLLPAGLPLPRALDAAAKMGDGQMATVLGEIRTRVERGERLANALRAHAAIFPTHYVGLVRAGERAGDLAGAFVRLSDQLERESQLRAKLASALLYPAILASAGGIAMLVLLLVVLPNFATLLTDAGAKLPATTSIVLAVSGGLRRFWFVLPVAVIVPVIVIARAWADSTGRLTIATTLDRLPLLGPMLREMAAARFARITGTLIAGGAPLLGALEDAESAVGSPLQRAAAGRIRVAVREGAPLHAALAREKSFPPLLAQLTALGEESARLGEFLLKAATLFEERTERVTQRLVSLAEPAMIVAFGGVIGFVALSLLQAIYSVNAGTFR